MFSTEAKLSNEFLASPNKDPFSVCDISRTAACGELTGSAL